MTRRKFLIVVGGPTAAGKTDLAIALAKAYQTEIVSADARQFYKEMQIGTAKPTAMQLSAVQHHFISHLSVMNAYDVGQFETHGIALLDHLFQQHNMVILCGGSGLFIKAITDGLDVFPDIPPEIRTAVRDAFEQHGIEALQKELAEKDPVYFAQVDQKNPHRLLRALEVIRATGEPFSSFHAGAPKQRNFIPIRIMVDPEREELYQRIDNRVDQMMLSGLLEEARALYPYRNFTALQTVGYTELFHFLEGKYNLNRAVHLIKQHTRNYAKRQITWFRKNGLFHPVQNNPAEVITYIDHQIQKADSI